MEESSLNIINIITSAINTLFSNFFSSVDNNLYEILDKLFFINTDIIKNNYLEKIFGSNSSGIILICNSLLIGFILYYSISLLFSHITLQNIQRPNEFIFRLFLCAISINFSLFFCEKLIWFISTTSLAIQDLGESVLNTSINFSRYYTKF